MWEKSLLISLAGVLSLNSAVFCYAQNLPDAEKSDSLSKQTRALPAGVSPDDILPPTPKASSILRYGECPVSLYTGLVDISVPIYSIQRCGVTVPIDLKYHASGIRYDDVSIEAGLGWTLMAGGVVTRTIRGADDSKIPPATIKDAESLIACSCFPGQSGAGDVGPDYVYLCNIASGNAGQSLPKSDQMLDGEIDMYNFSFLNRSGSFCFPFTESEVSGSAPSTGVFIPADGMQVVDRSTINSILELLDTDGVKYTFKPFDNNISDSSLEYYLTEILSADKADRITFIYDTYEALSQECIQRPFINYTASLIKTRYATPSAGQYPFDDEVTESGGFHLLDQLPARLKRIEFRGGYVDFVYQTQNPANAWDLKQIEIYNNVQPTALQTISLSKGMFNDHDPYYQQYEKRQRLDGVTFTDSQGHSYKYEFGYNGNPGVNNYNTGSASGIDYWGYYNGESVPYAKRYAPWFEGMDSSIKSFTMSRKPNESAMQGGILNKIVYPTKGYSQFKYEAHRVENSNKISGGLRIKEICNYLPDGTLAERKWYKYGVNESGFGDANIKSPSVNDFMNESRTMVFTITSSTYEPFIIKSIYRYLSQPKRSYFTSGSSVVYPEVTEYVGNASQDYGKTVYKYGIRLDEAMYPEGRGYRFGSSDGYAKTYPWITNPLREKIIYKKEGSAYSPVYQFSNSYKEINQATFRNLRVLTFLSQINDPESGSSTAPKVLERFCPYHKFYDENPPARAPYNYFNYYITTGLQLVSNTWETKDGVTKETTYDYNKYGRPTLITEKSRTGEDDLVTVKKYPGDKISNGVYANMLARNIVSPEIEQIIHRGSNYLSSAETEYSTSKSVNPNLYAPMWTKFSNGPDNPDLFPLIMQYNKYDIYGNPLYVTAYDKTDIVYLWSYETVYPVIQVRNATYQDVERILSASKIESLSTMVNPTEQYLQECVQSLNIGLPNALVTSYTYEPLIGMKSATDPSGRTTYYSHDHFGRLEKIADEQGNALQTYEYNYRQ